MNNAIYCQIPNINGDTTEKNHKQWIKCESILFHSKRIIRSEPGHIANRESSRPQLSEITFTKKTDSASSLLFGESCTGKAHDTILIHICKTSSDGLDPILELTLENVIISQFHFHLKNEDDNVPAYPLEEIKLSFDKIEMKTTPHDEKGVAKTPISYGYDLKTAAAA